MPAFATLEDVKRSLRIEPCVYDDDTLIEMLIETATGAVINYLKSSADQYLDSGGDAVDLADIPAPIRMATIYLACVMYRSPDNNDDGSFDGLYLPPPVVSLLYNLRDPALA